MHELNNWTEVTKGIYRFIIAPGACYEIHILYQDLDSNILSANCNLYVVGVWRGSEGSYFERELLLTGPMAACLQKAVEDYNDNVEE